MINPRLEDKTYLLVLTSIKKKINITKIRTNSHKLHSETWHYAIPKTSWDKRICLFYDIKRVQDENHFDLECPLYMHIKSQFKTYIAIPAFLTL